MRATSGAGRGGHTLIKLCLDMFKTRKFRNSWTAFAGCIRLADQAGFVRSSWDTRGVLALVEACILFGRPNYVPQPGGGAAEQETKERFNSKSLDDLVLKQGTATTTAAPQQLQHRWNQKYNHNHRSSNNKRNSNSSNSNTSRSNNYFPSNSPTLQIMHLGVTPLTGHTVVGCPYT